MTILRAAHMDLEGRCHLSITISLSQSTCKLTVLIGLVLDGQVRSLRDQFVTHNWSILLYNG